jgi:hypothetical protein
MCCVAVPVRRLAVSNTVLCCAQQIHNQSSPIFVFILRSAASDLARTSQRTRFYSLIKTNGINIFDLHIKSLLAYYVSSILTELNLADDVSQSSRYKIAPKSHEAADKSRWSLFVTALQRRLETRMSEQTSRAPY